MTAYDCAAYPDARGAPHLRATLSNKTDETVTSVGVFAYTDDSFADYEFTAKRSSPERDSAARAQPSDAVRSEEKTREARLLLARRVV